MKINPSRTSSSIVLRVEILSHLIVMAHRLSLSLVATLFLCVVVGSSRADTTTVDLAKLSQSRPWLRLLHYKSKFPFGTIRSEAEPGPFFFSPQGRTDPYAELQADIVAFKTAQPMNAHGMSPQCAFPARYRFLKAQLHWDMADEACAELDAFIKKIGGDKISVVFSSAYPNSPPSMFGHTMIRIHSSGNRSDLLDYGINYAALAGPDENAIAFAVFGLMGGYFGHFSADPYYMKVNEYNHADSRDLWEYELNFSPEEIRFLVFHLWELNQNATFRYYFFDENCSYRILTVIEAAKPDWDLSQFAIEVVPAETIKRLTETPGAVTDIHHRPSLHVQMRERFDELSSEEYGTASQLIHGEKPASATSDAAPLEAAVSYFQFRRLKGANHLEPANQKIYTSLLVQRAKLGKVSEPDSVPIPQSSKDTQPDLGHAPYLLGVGGGVLSEGAAHSDFSELHFKFAYHDLLNKDLGYIKFSEVDFPNIALRYSHNLNSFWIERLGIVTVVSLFPITDLEKQLSWKFNLGYVSPKDLNCVDCHAVMMEGGGGVAKGIFSDRVLFYGMGILRTEAGSSIQNGVRLLPTVLAATLINPIPDFKTRLSGAFVSDIFQTVRQSHFYELGWDNSLSLAQNWEMRANAKLVIPGSQTGNRQANVTYQEYGLNLNRYF